MRSRVYPGVVTHRFAMDDLSPSVTAVVRMAGDEWERVSSATATAFRRGDAVLVVGSAISAPSPTEIPVASQTSDAIRQRLAGAIEPSLRGRFRRLVRDMPFEVLLGRLKEIDPDLAEAAVLDLTTAHEPNVVHRQIAAMFTIAQTLGVRFHCVTSNYDEGIELALRELGSDSRTCDVISTATAARAFGDAPRQLFHIHGRTTRPRRLVVDFRDEFALSAWKKRHLRALAGGDTTLVIVGFSGWDLGIGRQLRQLPVRDVIWFHGSPDRLLPSVVAGRRTWPLAMIELASAARARGATFTTVATAHDVGAALAQLSGVASDPAPPKSRVTREQRLDAACPVAPAPPHVRLWARWTGLRAGLSALGDLRDDERAQLTPEREAEFESFAAYYAARHIDGARLQIRAADLSWARTTSLEEFVYHRTLGVEYLNRAALTLPALRLLVETLLIAELRVLKARRRPTRRLVSELIGAVATVPLMWPFAAVFGVSIRSASLMRPAGAVLGRLLEGRSFQAAPIIQIISSRPDSIDFARAQELYEWLGQPARLINLWRLRSADALARGTTERDVRLLDDAEELAAKAFWAAEVAGDPLRRAKCLLMLIEVHEALHERARTACRRRIPEQVRRLGYGETWKDAAARAWEGIEAAQFSTSVRRLARRIYDRHGQPGSRRGRALRLYGLMLLETQ